MLKGNSITKFDNSLTEFLVNALADKYGDAKSYAYKYNNLKVYMDPQKVSTPHFYVSIGISEACFDIADGRKIDGSLGVEDTYVKRWAGRTNIQRELENYWKMLKDAITAELADDSAKKSIAQIRLRRAETAEERLRVDMTGTGIIRRNKNNQQKRLYKFKKAQEEKLSKKKQKRQQSA
jgi:Holliday junction resolvase RusA-like endonuclease